MVEENVSTDAINGHTMSQFKHDPLPDASEYIRLLSIDYPASATTAQYHLSAWILKEAPQYHAISYTWGSADRHQLIELDGQQMPVRWNCAYVLHQICHFRTAQYYWLDTLCINQSDLEEKGQQVAMMGSVFHMAEHVLACLGELEDEDILGLRILQQYCPRLSYLSQTADIEMGPDLQRNFADWLSNSLAEADIFNLWMTCNRLIRRHYFTRVWTVPEFLLARDLALYIGDFRVSWRSLHEVLHFLIDDQNGTLGLRCIHVSQGSGRVIVRHDKLGDYERDRYRRNDLPANEQRRILHRFLSLVSLRQSLIYARPDPTDHSLSLRDQLAMTHILNAVHRKSSSDPRDSIYAMLPFFAARCTTPMYPDYRKNPLDLAAEVLQVDELDDPQTFGSWLVENLRLERRQDVVQGAITERSARTDRWHDAKRSRPQGLRHRIYVTALAWRLSLDSEWRLGPQKRDRAVRPVLANDTNEVVGVAGAHSRAGDWVLAMRSDKHLHQLDLIVRQVEDRYYAVVSLAKRLPWDEHTWCRRSVQTSVETGIFRISFDPSDYVAYLASRVYDTNDVNGESDEFPAAELVNAGVCREPFSSFAELRS